MPSTSPSRRLDGPRHAWAKDGPRADPRLWPAALPVGRLDIDSTGLILLTNDGELANRMTHPRFEIPKTYVAEVQRGPSVNGRSAGSAPG